jgi:hypothetical protein
MEYSKYTIKQAVIDEGDATCMMSLVYWKALSSLTLSNSLNMLTAFDGHSFYPHGIILAFPVQLGGKMVEVEVEVVDLPLDYNLLLGCNWTYSMVVVVLSIFRTLCFPHQGEIVTIDLLSFAYSSLNASIGPSIPVIKNSQPETKNIGVRMYSSLMGNFNFSTPIHHVYSMSSRPALAGRSIPFHTSYISDPWTLPSLNSSWEAQSHACMAMPLSVAEIEYQAVIESSIDPDPVTSPTDKEDPILRPVWATSLTCSHDFLNKTLLSNEAILEEMNSSKRPWDDMYHRSYSLPSIERIEEDEFQSTSSDIVGQVVVTLDTHDIYAEGNIVIISPTILIDISCTPRNIESVNIGVDFSLE